MTDRPTTPVLLYDGGCGICNRSIQFILRHDRHGTLRFAALESDFARGVIERHPDLRDVDSMVFVDNPGRPDENVSIRSAAGLAVAGYLGGPFKALLAARIIPAGIRDRLYDRFAAARYRLGGRRDTCPLPAPEVRARFLDA